MEDMFLFYFFVFWKILYISLQIEITMIVYENIFELCT